jgi:hypothetical protein
MQQNQLNPNTVLLHKVASYEGMPLPAKPVHVYLAWLLDSAFSYSQDKVLNDYNDLQLAVNEYSRSSQYSSRQLFEVTRHSADFHLVLSAVLPQPERTLLASDFYSYAAGYAKCFKHGSITDILIDMSTNTPRYRRLLEATFNYVFKSANAIVTDEDFARFKEGLQDTKKVLSPEQVFEVRIDKSKLM